MGAKRKLNILEKFDFDVKKMYNATREELIGLKNIGEKTSEIILNEERKKIVDKHLDYMLKHNIDIVSIKDDEYPKLLRQIYDAPIAIYVLGDKRIFNEQKNIAIIGCRKCSEYGSNTAKKLAYDLSNEKTTIISGLAKGIDSFAHEGAIFAKQKTVAVLGNGLDIIYPKENINLAKEIIDKKGAIISEYPLGTKPDKNNFPERNRIVSGMSQGIIVVEAKKKSGTLITVDFALEQGRDVFVVPGNLNSENSEGTNELIKQGAKIITNYKDIIEEYI